MVTTVNPLYSKVPGTAQKLYYREIFTIESVEYSVKIGTRGFRGALLYRDLYYREVHYREG